MDYSPENVKPQEIIDRLLSYDQNCDVDLVKKAIDFAVHYHKGQFRESGEPYHSHPLQVAYMVTELHLDTASVITALLHDTIEDTDLELADLEKHFGKEIAKLVDGVTKLTKIEFQPDNVRQAENFRKLLLAMSDDIRVLLVKLVDRLHNMRTIDSIKSDSRRIKIALETMEIYAPLAERIGAQQIKLELQDTAFKVLHADIRESIINRLQKVSTDAKYLINETIQEIAKILKNSGIQARVYGRYKTPYSIWMKMKQKGVGFEQLYDIIAFRIIVKTIPECYQVLGVIHSTYKTVPENFQDFISLPKSNGYQSLHTLVIGPKKKRIEIQIRTEDMHAVAELGVAAHWQYKQEYKGQDGVQYRWIRELLNILEHTNDPEEFLKNTKLAMYYDQVFCFTPQGNLIALPKGATPIDFAYAVHSHIGNQCVAANVNNKLAPLNMILQNGDQVEIITSRNQLPSPTWAQFVVTGKARSEIQKFIRSKKRQEYITLGQEIFEKTLNAVNVSDTNQPINEAITKFKKKNKEDLFFAIGDGSITRESIVKLFTPNPTSFAKTLSLFGFSRRKKEETNHVPIQGLTPGMVIHFAECCHPIPGDKIVGISHPQRGIVIHTKDCSLLLNSMTSSDNIIELTWNTDSSNIPYISHLKVILPNKPGSLAALTSELAKYEVNITNIKIIGRDNDFFHLIIDITVNNAEQLESIISILKTNQSIQLVEKVEA